MQAGDLPGEIGEFAGEPGGSQDLRHGLGLILIHRQQHPAGVRVVPVVLDEFGVTFAVDNDPQALPVVGTELIADPHTWQEGFGNVHTAILPHATSQTRCDKSQAEVKPDTPLRVVSLNFLCKDADVRYVTFGCPT